MYYTCFWLKEFLDKGLIPLEDHTFLISVLSMEMNADTDFTNLRFNNRLKYSESILQEAYLINVFFNNILLNNHNFSHLQVQTNVRDTILSYIPLSTEVTSKDTTFGTDTYYLGEEEIFKIIDNIKEHIVVNTTTINKVTSLGKTQDVRDQTIFFNDFNYKIDIKSLYDLTGRNESPIVCNVILSSPLVRVLLHLNNVNWLDRCKRNLLGNIIETLYYTIGKRVFKTQVMDAYLKMLEIGLNSRRCGSEVKFLRS